MTKKSFLNIASKIGLYLSCLPYLLFFFIAITGIIEVANYMGYFNPLEIPSAFILMFTFYVFSIPLLLLSCISYQIFYYYLKRSKKTIAAILFSLSIVLLLSALYIHYDYIIGSIQSIPQILTLLMKGN